MTIQFAPNGVDTSQTGSLIGIVRSISQYPLSAEGVVKSVGNSQLAQYIISKAGGAASLAMILVYYGKWIPLEKSRQECGVTRDDSNAENILIAVPVFNQIFLDDILMMKRPDWLKNLLVTIAGTIIFTGFLNWLRASILTIWQKMTLVDSSKFFWHIIRLPLTFFYMRRRLVDLNMKVQQDVGREYGVLMNGLMMIESIKGSGNEDEFFSKWAGYKAKVINGMQEIQLWTLKVKLLPSLFAGVNGALIIAIGGFSIMEGVMTAEIYMAFQNLFARFQERFNKLLMLVGTLQTIEMQMQRFDDVRKSKLTA